MATQGNNSKQTPEAAEAEVKDLFGFVPEFFAAFPKSTTYANWAVQRDLELGDTVLDHKTKELIGLAVAAHMKCEYCTYFHGQAAKLFGASSEELKEAAAIGGMTSMFSNSLHGMSVDVKQFRKDTDKALEAVKSKLM